MCVSEVRLGPIDLSLIDTHAQRTQRMVWHGVHLATIARQINLLKEYHQTDPELLNLSDDAYGMTPLIWACGEWRWRVD